MQKIEELISQNRLDEALAAVQAHIDSDDIADDSAYFTLGKLLWRTGHRSEAMEAYAKAAALNPAGPAVIALQQAQEIFSFYNPDLLNP